MRQWRKLKWGLFLYLNLNFSLVINYLYFHFIHSLQFLTFSKPFTVNLHHSPSNRVEIDQMWWDIFWNSNTNRDTNKWWHLTWYLTIFCTYFDIHYVTRFSLSFYTVHDIICRLTSWICPSKCQIQLRRDSVLKHWTSQRESLILIYLLTAVGLTLSGSSTVHIYTQTIHRTTQLTTHRTTLLTTNWEEWGPCPIFVSYTLAFALQLRKKHGKTSVRVAEECQLAWLKQNIQNRTTTEYMEQNIQNWHFF
jgi:hypothetical protein